MSDNIPFEIEVEIIKRLPVKSLIQFRSVSKTWKSLIDSSDFIAQHSSQHTQMQHLLVTCYNPVPEHDQKYISFVDDDDTFPQQKVCLTVPKLVNRLAYYGIIGCSHGLLCLHGYHVEDTAEYKPRTGMVVIWNLSIRKAVAVIVPNLVDQLLGFGVCRETTEAKIVKISPYSWTSDLFNTVEVFTLSTGAWRSPYSNLPRKSIRFNEKQIVVNGILYWLATERITTDDGFRFYNLIVSFDMTSEEFSDVNLPDNLASISYTSCMLYLSKLRNALVMLERDADCNNSVFVVWMMEDGVTKSFAKLFSVNVGARFASVKGFRKSGAPIVEILVDDHGELVVYEPYSKNLDNFWIYGKVFSSAVYPYVETLLLLDHPDDMVYND